MPEQANTTSQFKRQLPKNVTFQTISFVLRVGIGLWLVPYLLQHLGRAAYGLIPLAAVMTEYASMIAMCISNAVNRFLTIAIQKNDEKEANQIFSTAFFTYAVLILIQIPIFYVIIRHAQTIFTIPDEIFRDAVILFVCSALSFMINLIRSVFAVPQFAFNRIDISRALESAYHIFRLVGILVLFAVFSPALRYIGYVTLVNSLFQFIASLVVCKKLAPLLKIRISYFDKSRIKKLVHMGGWLLVNYVGFLFFLRIDLWVCNKFISAEAAGEYAALLQWSNLIRQGGQMVAGLLGPMIMIYYARSEVENLVKLSKLSIKVFPFFLAIPISLLCIWSGPLLTLWLDESYAKLAPIMIIMLCHLVLNIGVTPLFHIQTATNRVKWPGIVTLIMGMINVLLSIVFVKYFGWGFYGIAFAGAIVLTAKNSIFTPIYGAYILKLPWYTFLSPFLHSIQFIFIFAVINYGISFLISPNTIYQIVCLFLFNTLLGIAIMWFLMGKNEQKLICDMIPQNIKSRLSCFNKT